jgi:hypothetical protein
MEDWHKIYNAFAKFEAKDWITFCASISALVFSIITYRQKSGEAKLALRKQLTDLFEKLTDLNLQSQMARLKRDEFPQNYWGLLNDQRRFLARQAAFISQRIETLVTPWEYLLLAWAFDEISDSFQAERYFLLATETAVEPFDRAIITRSYARYLFNQGPETQEKSRRLYQQAVHSFGEETDRIIAFRAETFERWALQEREWSHVEDADRLFHRAATEFENLSNPARRKHERERLQNVIKPKPSKEQEAVRTVTECMRIVHDRLIEVKEIGSDRFGGDFKKNVDQQTKDLMRDVEARLSSINDAEKDRFRSVSGSPAIDPCNSCDKYFQEHVNFLQAKVDFLRELSNKFAAR